MKRNRSPVWSVLLLLGVGVLIPVMAKSPVELPKVAPAADLKAEAEAQIEAIASWTASPELHAENKDDVRRAAGVLAALGQALAEHPGHNSLKLSPIALREAALQLVKSQNFEQAKSAFAAAQAALQKEVPSLGSPAYKWEELISMDDMMHVINTRNSQLLRAARRSRDPEKDSRHATTIAVLTLVMAEQTDYLADDADKKAWKTYALDFQQGMSDVAAALKAKDKAATSKHLARAAKACNDCHAQFRDQE